MRVVHEPADGEARVLASEVETADTFREQVMGMRFRDPLPEGRALVFRSGEPPAWSIRTLETIRTIDMLGVGHPLDVLWVLDGTVRKVKTARPWIGMGIARADTVIELPAGAADAVEVGDRVSVDDGDPTH